MNILEYSRQRVIQDLRNKGVPVPGGPRPAQRDNPENLKRLKALVAEQSDELQLALTEKRGTAARRDLTGGDASAEQLLALVRELDDVLKAVRFGQHTPAMAASTWN
jgi:hypothetical protein